MSDNRTFPELDTAVILSMVKGGNDDENEENK
jgi:hypothetical protein